MLVYRIVKRSTPLKTPLEPLKFPENFATSKPFKTGGLGDGP